MVVHKFPAMLDFQGFEPRSFLSAVVSVEIGDLEMLILVALIRGLTRSLLLLLKFTQLGF